MRKILPFLLLSVMTASSCKPDRPETIVEPEQPELQQFTPFAKQISSGTTYLSLKSKDGHIVSAGTDGSGSFVLRKISMTNGSTLWTKTIPIPALTEVSSLAETADGDILVAGLEPGTEQKPIIVVSAHGSDGDAKWHKQYGNAVAYHYAPQIVRLHNNNLMIAAKSSYLTTVLYRVIINSGGDEVNTASIETNVGQYPRMILMKDNSVVLVSTVGNTLPHPYLTRMNADGDIIGEQSITVPSSTYVYDIEEINNGELLLCGTRFETGQKDKGFVMRVSTALSEVETKIYSRTEAHVAIIGLSLTDEGYTGVGRVSDQPANANQGFLVTCTPQGEMLREKTYPVDGGKIETFHNIWQQDKNFVVLGNMSNYNHTDPQVFVMGLDKDGNPK